MTRDEAIAHVEKLVTEIRETAGDNESSHYTEDYLMEWVLRHIACGAIEPADAAAVATAALASKQIEFDRWYA